MNILTEKGNIVIEKIYNPILLKADNQTVSICERDGLFEVTIQDGKQHTIYIDELDHIKKKQLDFSCWLSDKTRQNIHITYRKAIEDVIDEFYTSVLGLCKRARLTDPKDDEPMTDENLSTYLIRRIKEIQNEDVCDYTSGMKEAFKIVLGMISDQDLEYKLFNKEEDLQSANPTLTDKYGPKVRDLLIWLKVNAAGHDGKKYNGYLLFEKMRKKVEELFDPQEVNPPTSKECEASPKNLVSWDKIWEDSITSGRWGGEFEWVTMEFGTDAGCKTHKYSGVIIDKYISDKQVAHYVIIVEGTEGEIRRVPVTGLRKLVDLKTAKLRNS